MERRILFKVKIRVSLNTVHVVTSKFCHNNIRQTCIKLMHSTKSFKQSEVECNGNLMASRRDKYGAGSTDSIQMLICMICMKVIG